MTSSRVELAEIELPAYELDTDQPSVPASTFEARLAAAEAAAAGAGLDALVVYADREHFANMSYLTGFDPRFEEALLVLVPGRRPTLLVGNECEAYAAVVPYPVDLVRYQSFSLVNQDRSASAPLGGILRAAGLGPGGARRVGVAGWKYFGPAEAARPEDWIEAPAFIVDELRALGGQPVNASALFTEPGRGLRLINDVDQLACFEFAAAHGSESMRRLLDGVRPGMTELAAFSLYRPIGLPQSYHPVLASGERAALGLASASGRVLRRGDPMSASLGYWGSNIARSGFLAADSSDLPVTAGGYVERLVAPYFACAAEWYETIGIGVTGGELFEVARRHLSDPFFGVHLNPGHFIHLDEWPSSPVYSGSGVELDSGMALQLDIIPATGTVYHTTNIEDGVALADAGDPRAARGPLPGDVAAGRPAPCVHGRRARDHAPAGGAAAVEPGRLPAAVLAVTAAGHAQALTAALRADSRHRAAGTGPPLRRRCRGTSGFAAGRPGVPGLPQRLGEQFGRPRAGETVLPVNDEERHAGDPDLPGLILVGTDRVGVTAVIERPPRLPRVNPGVPGQRRERLRVEHRPSLGEVRLVQPLQQRLGPAKVAGQVHQPVRVEGIADGPVRGVAQAIGRRRHGHPVLGLRRLGRAHPVLGGQHLEHPAGLAGLDLRVKLEGVIDHLDIAACSKAARPLSKRRFPM